MQEENRFENILKSLRVRKGKAWTQEKTAQELGVSRRLYVGWENGDSLPSQSDLRNIASLFKLSPEDENTLYRATAQVSPRVHNLPLPQNPFFTGRERQLKMLGQLFEANNTVAISQPVSVSGLGGIGKTELALEYAHRCYQDKTYRAVFWIDAAEKATIEASYLSFARCIGLSQKDEEDTDKVVQAVKQWLEEHTNWLLIMDNTDDLGLARSFMPIAHKGHILLTTRSQIVGKVARQFEVQEMEPEEAVRFLLRRAKVLRDDTDLNLVEGHVRKPANQLVELLGALPLALEQAGAYIEETGVSLAEYARLLREHRNYLMHRQGTLDGEWNGHPDSIATTVEISIRKASEQHPLATDILRFCVFLQPDNIPEEIFQQDSSLKLDTLAFREGIMALRRYSLIKFHVQERHFNDLKSIWNAFGIDPIEYAEYRLPYPEEAEAAIRQLHDSRQTFAVHRLVQAVIIDGLSFEQQKQLQRRVVRALRLTFSYVEKHAHWGVGKRLVPHVSMYLSWEDDDQVSARDASQLFLLTGFYLDTGKNTEAEQFLVRSLAIRDQWVGTDHPDTGLSLLYLACFYLRLEMYGKAEPLYERALSVYWQWWGLDSLHSSRCIAGLLTTYYVQGKHEQAIALRQRIVSYRENRAESDQIAFVKAIYDLARLYTIVPGKFAEAESCLLQILAICEEYQNKSECEHVLEKALRELVHVYLCQDRYEDAERIIRRLLSDGGGLGRSSYLATLAYISRKLGMYEEAEALLDESGYPAMDSMSQLVKLDIKLDIMEEIDQIQAVPGSGANEPFGGALFYPAILYDPRMPPPTYYHDDAETRAAYAKYLLSIGRDADDATVKAEITTSEAKD